MNLISIMISNLLLLQSPFSMPTSKPSDILTTRPSGKLMFEIVIDYWCREKPINEGNSKIKNKKVLDFKVQVNVKNKSDQFLGGKFYIFYNQSSAYMFEDMPNKISFDYVMKEEQRETFRKNETLEKILIERAKDSINRTWFVYEMDPNEHDPYSVRTIQTEYKDRGPFFDDSTRYMLWIDKVSEDNRDIFKLYNVGKRLTPTENRKLTLFNPVDKIDLEETYEKMRFFVDFDEDIEKWKKTDRDPLSVAEKRVSVLLASGTLKSATVVGYTDDVSFLPRIGIVQSKCPPSKKLGVVYDFVFITQAGLMRQNRGVVVVRYMGTSGYMLDGYCIDGINYVKISY